MIGLPESTKLDEINTAKALIKLKPKIVRIYPVLVIKNTPLAKEYEQGEYIPLTVEQAVDRAKDIMQLFNNAKRSVLKSFCLRFSTLLLMLEIDVLSIK